MIDVTLTIDGVSLSDRLSTYSYSKETNYRAVITTLDNVEHPYPGGQKPIIAFSLLPGTDEQDSELYDVLSKMICEVTYTEAGVDVTRRMRLVTSLDSTFLLKSVDGKRRYRNGIIRMRGL